jgi:TetR/AcrR family transcriptional repressor of nem operon
MSWPKDHKSRTRERIVQAAAAAFRAGGISGVRLEDVMANAGLTHGGFYAHFASKDELLGESLEHASGETVEMLSKPLAALQGDDRFRALIDAYLSPAHVAHPERGCPLASLGPEIARAGGTTQRNLAEGVRARLDWMRQLRSEGQRDAVSDNQVIGMLACMVGGLILARTVGGRDSTVVLSACREFLHRTLDEPPKVATTQHLTDGRKGARAGRSKRGLGGRSAAERRRR